MLLGRNPFAPIKLAATMPRVHGTRTTIRGCRVSQTLRLWPTWFFQQLPCRAHGIELPMVPAIDTRA